MTNPLNRHWLAIIPWLTAALFLSPVIVGLMGTWLPAFGWFPAIGADHFSLAGWQQLLRYPGFSSAIQHTLVTGLGAALLSLLLTLLLLIGGYPSRAFLLLEKTLSPILSVPHAAFAIGMGFLLTPSGWLIRLLQHLTPWFNQPPSWTLFQDPNGLALIIVLALKETPFLLFMSLAVLPSLQANRTLWLAKSMGHSARFTWLCLLLPPLYQQIRLPFYAIVAYSLTVVDMAMIAGPTTPPTLAVMVTQLFNDPTLSQRLVGAAGASMLLLLVILVLILLRVLEYPLVRLRCRWLHRGPSPTRSWNWERPMAGLLATALMVFYSLTLLVTLFWSFTGRWRFPDVIPAQWSTHAWYRLYERMLEPLWCSFNLALLSAAIALVLVIAALENEVRLKYRVKTINSQRILWLIYLPLLVPQIAFLFGFQVWLIQLNLEGRYMALLWSHLVFVVPYVFLTLSGPYREFDDRYSWLAISLTGSRSHGLWRVKLPMLLRPILYAFATGFSVSIAQYLPTLFVGAGKYVTVTTEAVAMASGSDRRLMAVIALWQQLLPLLAFAIATIIPMLRFRHNRAMQQFVRN